MSIDEMTEEFAYKVGTQLGRLRRTKFEKDTFHVPVYLQNWRIQAIKTMDGKITISERGGMVDAATGCLCVRGPGTLDPIQQMSISYENPK